MEEKASLRDHIESAMEQVESGAEPIEQVESLEVAPQDDIAAETAANRDESGRFKAKETQEDEPASLEENSTEIENAAPVEVAAPLPRPSTWKKEYMPIWDKLEKGEALSKEESRKLAEYSNQRESEYKKGVSTYKAEAERARSLEEAINPFVPELQSQGISPAAWINNLGRAHMVLTKASYNERVQMFHKLAQDYGIQLNASGEMIQQPTDQYSQQLMQQLQQVNQEVGAIKSRFQQEEDQRLSDEISKYSSDVEKYPHFEALREDMAQLLELGKAQDLESAYKYALRLNDDVWQQEQERLLTQAKHDAIKQQQIAKAKSAAVSVKSTTPSGKVQDGVDTKDRRAVLAAQMDAFGASRV